MNTQLLLNLFCYYILIGVLYMMYVITDVVMDVDGGVKYLWDRQVDELYNRGHSESRIRWMVILAIIIATISVVVTWPTWVYDQLTDKDDFH